METSLEVDEGVFSTAFDSKWSWYDVCVCVCVCVFVSSSSTYT